MKVEKKIIRQSYDYNKEKEYYKEARVCPNCGNNQEELHGSEYIMAKSTGHITICELGTEDGNRVYECTKCGCQWKVKSYR